MPDFCAAYGCSNRRCVKSRQRGITFHVFPKAGERRRQWEVAMRRKNFVVCDRTTICSEHFRPEDFDRTGQTVRLKAGAVPTIFNFPARLQRPVSKRSTATSRRAEEKLDLSLNEPKLDVRASLPSPSVPEHAPSDVNHLPCSTPTQAHRAPPPQPEQGANGERHKVPRLEAADHTYGLPTCPKAIKAKLDAAAARVRQLEREKTNALMRERRAKKNMQALLEEL